MSTSFRIGETEINQKFIRVLELYFDRDDDLEDLALESIEMKDLESQLKNQKITSDLLEKLNEFFVEQIEEQNDEIKIVKQNQFDPSKQFYIRVQIDLSKYAFILLSDDDTI